MDGSADLRMKRIPLNHGTGRIPALGFGTLIPDLAETITATKDALEAGFRHFDCAQLHSDQTAAEYSGEHRRSGFLFPKEDEQWRN